MVTVRDTATRQDLRGRFGVVRKIRITDHDAYVMVFVELFNHETGGADLMIFEPKELQRRKNLPAGIKRPIATHERHAIVFEELIAA